MINSTFLYDTFKPDKIKAQQNFQDFLKDFLYMQKVGHYSVFYHVSVHEIAAGQRSLSGTISCVTNEFLMVWPTGFVFCRSQWPAGFQISIVYHIQKTGTNYEWPVRSADCRTRFPALTKYLVQALTSTKVGALKEESSAGDTCVCKETHSDTFRQRDTCVCSVDYIVFKTLIQRSSAHWVGIYTTRFFFYHPLSCLIITWLNHVSWSNL